MNITLSQNTTVARMKCLLSGLSYPRDSSNANHAGLIQEPLEKKGRWISHSAGPSSFWYASPSSHNLHNAAKPTMVCCERRIIQTPPLKFVPVPLFDWQVNGEFHPMSLSFIVAKHRGNLEAFEMFALGKRQAQWSECSNGFHMKRILPEYGFKATAHRTNRANRTVTSGAVQKVWF